MIKLKTPQYSDESVGHGPKCRFPFYAKICQLRSSVNRCDLILLPKGLQTWPLKKVLFSLRISMYRFQWSLALWASWNRRTMISYSHYYAYYTAILTCSKKEFQVFLIFTVYLKFFYSGTLEDEQTILTTEGMLLTTRIRCIPNTTYIPPKNSQQNLPL